MKHIFFASLFFALSMYSWGQSTSPSPSAEQPGVKNLGWSLRKDKKAGRGKKSDSPDKSKSSDTAADNEVIKVKTDLVVSDVLVTDQKATVITGLKKDDFIVTEDGITQGIEMFSASESPAIPRSIVIVIDRSVIQRPYVRTSIEAAKVLVGKLRQNDRLAIVTADTHLVQDFTGNKTVLGQKLDGLMDYPVIPIRAWDEEFEALIAVLDEMFTDKAGEQIVIFQTDGAHSIWLQDDKDAPIPVSDSLRMVSGMQFLGRAKSMSRFGFGDVKAAIERSQATIYSIIPGIRFVGLSDKERTARAKLSWQNMLEAIAPIEKARGKTHGEPTQAVTRAYEEREIQVRTIGQTAMFKVAELSGGNAGFIEKPEDAENAYSDVFKIIQNRYVIGYYPTNERHDGKLRQIKIEVRGHPEYTVTGRKAYFAPE